MTIEELKADVISKRAAYQQAMDAWDAWCFGIDRTASADSRQQAYLQATTALNRAQYRLENHPDMTFDLWSEMFEPHPVPYPVSC